MKYCVAIVMDNIETNCLFEYEMHKNADGTPGIVNHAIFLDTIKKIINIYNSGKVFSSKNYIEKPIRIFEEMGGRLMKESFETLELAHPEWEFCGDRKKKANIGFLQKEINKNINDSKICFRINFDDKTIQMPIFGAMDKDSFFNNFKKGSTFWSYTNLQEADFDPDNIMFNELEDLNSFIKSHQHIEFRLKSFTNKVIFLKLNMSFLGR